MEKLRRQIDSLRTSLELMYEVGNTEKYNDLIIKSKKIMAYLGYSDDLLYMQVDVLNEIFNKGAVDKFKLN